MMPNQRGLTILASLTNNSRRASANEDAVGFSATAAWVIDGATGVSDRPPLVPDRSDAAWLANQLSSRLTCGFAEPYADPNSVLTGVEAGIEAEFRSFDSADGSCAADQPSAAFVLAALSAGRLHLLGLGDCRVLFRRVDGATEEFNPSDLRAVESAIIEQRRRLVEAYPGEDPWSRLKPLIRLLRRHVNTSAGYWVVHPTRPWTHRLKRRTLACAEVRHLLIVSDGLYRLVDVFGALDGAGLLQAALSDGLDPLCARLRDLEARDEACARFPRVKASDDASGLLVRIDA